MLVLQEILACLFVEENKVNSMFEFGCASGPNYLKLKHQIDYYFGFDINLLLQLQK